MLTTFEKETVALLCSVLQNRAVGVSSDYDVQRLYVYAREHRVLNMALYGLLASGVDQTHPAVQQLFFDATREVVVHENQMALFRKVCAAFEQNGIDHLPLKGVLMKALYPKPEMRSMSDADVLIRVEQYPQICAVLTSLGFEQKDESDHEYIWRKGMLTLELHKSVVPSYDTDFAAYFGNGWDRAVATEKPHSFAFSAEDMFVYLFCHFAKHYRDGGAGLKYMTDLRVYLTKISVNRTQVEEELEKLGLLTFYQNVEYTLRVWFEDADETEISELITRTVLQSGVYGTRQNKLRSAALREQAASDSTSKTAKGRLLWRILFPGRKEMCLRYPCLNKCQWAFPLFWVVHWVDALLHKWGSIRRRKADLKAVSAEQVAAYERDLRMVGLSFKLKG